jgi:chemotaxis methyl-accepting protein methylase
VPKSKPSQSEGSESPAPALVPSEHLFPIVGLGASAGGLEALELFLRHVPADCGMAFVIVQHLDPNHKGAMPELLQRCTTMPVSEVQDRTVVLPSHVYIIPPNKDLSLLHGTLHLFAPAQPRGLRLPIDSFFRSVADDQRERSVGIILSGSGSDGTLGLRAIKEVAGLVLVQDPASAKFDGMPRSAVDAGLADIVAPADELFDRLIGYLQYVTYTTNAEPVIEGTTQSALEKIAILLRTRTGHDFSQYKRNTLYRRIERRMGIHQIDRIANYILFLQQNPQEQDLLFHELLIGVTSFFRDPGAWEKLQETVIPALFAGKPEGGHFRAWVAGCSTGEEAYSLAIAFQEAFSRQNSANTYSLQVFATDLDELAINQARQGLYPENIVADVSSERLQHYFVKDEGGGYRVGRQIREMVTLAPQNMISDPPFTKVDILVCRNVLIYLTPELQKKLLPLFYYALNPGGYLFLGSAESTSSHAELFATIDSKWRIYQRIGSSAGIAPSLFALALPAHYGPASSKAGIGEVPANLQQAVERLLLQRHTPAAVLINDKGDILYISGRTGKYLEPAAGKANWNIYAMAREGLRQALTGIFQVATSQPAEGTLVVRGLRIKTNGDFQSVDLSVQAIHEPEILRGQFLLVFSDIAPVPEASANSRVGAPARRSAYVRQLEQETDALRRDLQRTREAMQASQEELRSAYEEQQSINEELQSTNEELTTSKEEMQSVNEELQTVNAELQVKVKELSLVNNDMKNLLNSTEIATLFLDDDLRVRRFTSQASKLIKLIPSDLGRPITDIASELIYPAFTEDVADVLQTLVFTEREVAAQDGRWFVARIMPYRTMENRIDGVVITFVDITAAKRLEAELRRKIDDAPGDTP